MEHECTTVVTRTKEIPTDWYEDYEITIQHPINGYNKIYRRIFYENGYVKRIVIGFSAEERELAANAILNLQQLETLKQTIKILE